MYQSMVEGRYDPWSLLVEDMPRKHHHDLDFIVDQLDWAKNLDPDFEDNHDLEALVTLRYFGLEVNPDDPKMGA